MTVVSLEMSDEPQFICSFSRIARYTPSLTNKLPTKTASQTDKAN